MKSILLWSTVPVIDLAQRPMMTTPFICLANGSTGVVMDVEIRLPPWNEGWQRTYGREGTFLESSQVPALQACVPPPYAGCWFQGSLSRCWRTGERQRVKCSLSPLSPQDRWADLLTNSDLILDFFKFVIWFIFLFFVVDVIDYFV